MRALRWLTYECSLSSVYHMIYVAYIVSWTVQEGVLNCAVPLIDRGLIHSNECGCLGSYPVSSQRACDLFHHFLLQEEVSSGAFTAYVIHVCSWTREGTGLLTDKTGRRP